MNILFVTWDGPQTSYLESLFLPIFSRLAENGLNFHVLQFTWANDAHCLKLKNICKKQECTYRSIKIWRRPIALGGLVSILLSRGQVKKVIQDLNIDVVMPRAPLSSLAVMWALASSTDCRFVYDSDGLPLDERVDFGQWSVNSLSYKLLRNVEARALRKADVVLLRSLKAVDVLISRCGAECKPAKFHVVVNGRNEERFKPLDESERFSVRHVLGVEQDAPLIIYAGSIGPQYCVSEMLQFFKHVMKRCSDARMVILSSTNELIDKLLEKHEDLQPFVQVYSVSPNEVPKYLAASDLGLALRRPTFSMQAVAPIKIGEYLLCGVPVLATYGIGDTDRILTEEVGLQLETMSDVELEEAAVWFLETVLVNSNKFRNCCRNYGLQYFSLEASRKTYLDAFSTLSLSGR